MMSFSAGADGAARRPATAHQQVAEQVARTLHGGDIEVNQIELNSQTEQVEDQRAQEQVQDLAGGERLDTLSRGAFGGRRLPIGMVTAFFTVSSAPPGAVNVPLAIKLALSGRSSDLVLPGDFGFVTVFPVTSSTVINGL